VFHTLVCNTLNRMMSDTKLDMLFLHGTPRREYSALQRRCRSCWIYDFDWDDIRVEQFEAYSNSKEATKLCSVNYQNVCGSHGYNSDIVFASSLLCVVDYNVDALKLRAPNLLLVLPNEVEFREQPTYGMHRVDISKGTLCSILSCLHIEDIPPTTLIVSESVLPYIMDTFDQIH
jgi:hypothetical protein